jgi:hypothetical protein
MNRSLGGGRASWSRKAEHITHIRILVCGLYPIEERMDKLFGLQRKTVGQLAIIRHDLWKQYQEKKTGAAR